MCCCHGDGTWFGRTYTNACGEDAAIEQESHMDTTISTSAIILLHPILFLIEHPQLLPNLRIPFTRHNEYILRRGLKQTATTEGREGTTTMTHNQDNGIVIIQSAATSRKSNCWDIDIFLTKQSQ